MLVAVNIFAILIVLKSDLPVFLLSDMTKVYATVLSRHHHLVRKSDGIYDPMEYENHPELYTSHFRTSVSFLLSCCVTNVLSSCPILPAGPVSHTHGFYFSLQAQVHDGVF